MEKHSLVCKICNTSVISIDEFFFHNHINHQAINNLTCPLNECFRFYSNQKSLKNHIHSHYNSKQNEKIISNFDNSKDALPSHSCLTDEKKATTASTAEILSELKMNLLKQILHLLADENISKTKSFEVLKNSFLNYSTVFKKLVQSSCLSQSENAWARNFEEFFCETPYVIKSEYRLKRALIDAGYYVESKEEIVHSAKKLIYVNGVPKMIDELTTVRVFNISEMLKKFFHLPNFTRDVLNYVEKLNMNSDGPVSNIIQSKLWKWHLSLREQIPSILHLPIFMYFDDFEPLNVLGYHSGAYKIGAVYMGLPFLPNDIASKLKYILPIALFFAEDRKTYGNKDIFAPIIKVLNELFSEGIPVTHPRFNVIKFIPVLILGDNLGLNGILGFVESFSAYFHCRFCRCIKSVMHKQTEEDITTLRNEFNYKEDVAANNVSETGVKEDCVFHDMKGFKVTKNFSVDLLHDLLEGGLHVDLCNVIAGLINKGYFTLQQLNDLTKTHNYGPCVKNKSIDDITVEMLNKDRIKCSGAEMETFFINFATIIGHKVPHDEDIWKLYIKAREIYSIVYA